MESTFPKSMRSNRSGRIWIILGVIEHETLGTMFKIKAPEWPDDRWLLQDPHIFEELKS